MMSDGITCPKSYMILRSVKYLMMQKIPLIYYDLFIHDYL